MGNELITINNPNELRLSEDDIYITVKDNCFVVLNKQRTIPAGTLIVLGVPRERQLVDYSSSITQLEWLPELPNRSSSSGSTSLDNYAFVCKEFKSWEIFPCGSTAQNILLNSQDFYKKLPNNLAWSALLAIGNLQDRLAILEDTALLSLAAHDFQNGKSNFPQLVHYRSSQEDRLYKVINRNMNTSATGLCSLFDLEVPFIFEMIFWLLFLFWCFYCSNMFSYIVFLIYFVPGHGVPAPN